MESILSADVDADSAAVAVLRDVGRLFSFVATFVAWNGLVDVSSWSYGIFAYFAAFAAMVYICHLAGVLVLYVAVGLLPGRLTRWLARKLGVVAAEAATDHTDTGSGAGS